MTMRRRFLLLALAPLALWPVLAPAQPRVIALRARRFAFTPNRIPLKKGEPVVIEATTEDVFMGLNIPDFGVRTDIVPGKTMQLAFAPDKAGTFPFVCDVFCGDGHEEMSGTLVVT